MPSADPRTETAANTDFLDSFAAVSEAVESGAGLPEVARAASRALGASVAVVDASANVLAVAGASPGGERAGLSAGDVLGVGGGGAAGGPPPLPAPRGGAPPPPL